MVRTRILVQAVRVGNCIFPSLAMFAITPEKIATPKTKPVELRSRMFPVMLFQEFLGLSSLKRNIMKTISIKQASMDGQYMWEYVTPNGIKRDICDSLKEALAHRGATIWKARCGGWVKMV